MNERFYYTTDGTTVIGPVTRVEFHQQVGYDNVINTIQVCPKGSEQWVTFLEYSRSQSQTTALAKPKVDKQALNGCAGCLALIAVFVLWIGVTAAFRTTNHVTESSKELVSNPKMPYRDIYKIYSPEEERAYQQKRLDAQFQDVRKEKEVSKTAGESRRDILVGVFCVAVAIALLVGAAKLYKSAHRI